MVETAGVKVIAGPVERAVGVSDVLVLLSGCTGVTGATADEVDATACAEAAEVEDATETGGISGDSSRGAPVFGLFAGCSSSTVVGVLACSSSEATRLSSACSAREDRVSLVKLTDSRLTILSRVRILLVFINLHSCIMG